MNTIANQTQLIYEITIEKYQLFGLRLKTAIPEPLTLHEFKNPSICMQLKALAVDVFSFEIEHIKSLLEQPKIGVVALDIPQVLDFDENDNVVLGVAIVMGIFSHLATPNIDPVNQLPFIMHTASHSNEQQLDSKGLEKFTPSMKLGFHNDGLLSPEHVEIPEHVVVYNCYINYRNPGNFMWIPAVLWNDKEKYEKLAQQENRKITVKLTPNYHDNEEGEIVNSILDYVDIPIGHTTNEGEYRFFLNGQVTQENNIPEHVALIQSIRNSLENNPLKICIPQRERRAFFMKNTAGFHARSIFEDPIEGNDLTRVYLRAVDVNSERYSSL